MDTNGLDFALMVFDHTEGAEQAYSRAPRSVDGVAWADQIAFVEHHRRNRIVVRGTFAGRYVDADDEQEFIGRKTAEGAVAGGAVGLLFGPAGLAVGLVGGGLAGGVAQERGSPHLRSAFFDEVRREVPEGHSAVIMMALPDRVDAMAGALEGHGGRLVRHHLSAEDAKALEDAVADDPTATPPAAT
ncbi:MAG TPA: DUF1269 domain-containing protein [Solirubrobacteraceae bacterium]|jgi:uncharacterized membrane protein|nr:DUF1269 domain-containing protein [Solirubrobacteraceae bacterium]